MKKRRILGIILCCTLLFTMLAACGDTADDSATAPPDNGGDIAPPVQQPSEPAGDKIYTLDFSDGNIDFVRVNMAPRKADRRTTVEVMQLDGDDALALSAPGGGEAHIGINLDDLLKDKIADVKTIVFDIFAECPDGKFSAVGGNITAKSDDAYVAGTNWSVYITTRNPNQVVLEFGSDQGFINGAFNLLEFSCTTNGPAEKGETPAIIGIKSISFYDGSNNGIEISTAGAGWTGPDNYGEGAVVEISRWPLPADERVYDGSFLQYYTFGVDGLDEVGVNDFLPHSVLNTSIGIEFEIDEYEEDTMVFIYFGAYNGWGWTQEDNVPITYADGKITLMWDDTGFDPMGPQEKPEGEDDGLKLRFGSWNANFTQLVKSVNLLSTGGGAGGNILEIPADERVYDGDFLQYYTFGVDGKEETGVDDFLPHSALNNSIGIMFEVEEFEGDTLVFIYFGAYNGWGWTQEDAVPVTYADGKVTLYWDDTGFDPMGPQEKPEGEDDGLKLRFGNWGVDFTSLVKSAALIMG